MDEIKNKNFLPKDIISTIQLTNTIKQTHLIKIENEKSKQNLKNENSVRPENPLRSKFKKSHTCGSLYAKCACNNNHSKINSPTLNLERKSLFETYSHPDTPFIFTNENKKPAESPTDSHNCLNYKENGISTKDGKVKISRPKRLSSPNIGNYAILDVAIHPEIVLNISKGLRRQFSDSPVKNKINSEARSESVKNLTNHHKERLNRRTLSENSDLYYDTNNERKLSEDFEGEEKHRQFDKSQQQQEKNHIKIEKKTKSDDDISIIKIIQKNSIENDVDQLSSNDNATTKNISMNNLEFLKLNALSYQQENIDSATKFFKESGILGPIMGNGTSSALRKTSKIQDSANINNIEQVRRNSKAFIKNIYENREIEEKLRNHQEEIATLKQIIKNRDDEISKLKREIDKLKSVLHKTVPAITPSAGDLLSSLQTNHCMSGQYPTAICSNLILNQNSMETNKLFIKTNNLPHLNNNHLNVQLLLKNENNTNTNLCNQSPIMKKQGVSAESCDVSGQRSTDFLIPKYEKDFRSKQLIKDAIMDNDFLKNLDSSQVRELVDSMYSREIPKGEYVINEGEAGAHLFVSVEGEFEVIKNGKILGIMGPGKAFGELAILYNCTRTASIRVLENSRVWVLDRRVFQQIMMRTGMQRIEENVNFLKSVPLLKDLSNDILTKIADVLEVEFYPAGAFIIRQGASGDTFYLISQGNVKVTQRLPERLIEEEIRTLGRGDYFGEQALIKEDKRTANIIAMSPGVECLTLDRASFTQLIGDLCELHERDYGDNERMFAFRRGDIKIPTLQNKINEEYLDIKLADLVPVATLGLGGFGRVELVKHIKNNELKPYALKCLKKQHIVETRQEDHVFSERTIMLSCDSPFICRLYRTFRDDKYIYMLLEACMGGEVWTILRDRGYFNDSTTQFIIGCVLQAFEYLHARGIVYRDLKPENLMLDNNGYVKLVDFGFAKYIGYSSKTWTFCGTPEYVAPEIILNKGHDRAVDYWALGVLIHELLTGVPPFTASDPMKTYNIILKGIDMIDFPRHVSRSAISLIKKLCRDVPVERLGYQKGVQDIKKNKWFQGFDWDGLANLTLAPPIIHPVEHSFDVCHFDSFPIDNDVPPDELSGWDQDF